jgi:hypothetical protein
LTTLTNLFRHQMLFPVLLFLIVEPTGRRDENNKNNRKSTMATASDK